MGCRLWSQKESDLLTERLSSSIAYFKIPTPKALSLYFNDYFYSLKIVQLSPSRLPALFVVVFPRPFVHIPGHPALGECLSSAEEGKVLAIWLTKNFALQSANDIITGSVDAHNHRGITLWEEFGNRKIYTL